MRDLVQEDYETIRALLADLKSLIRADHISAETKLQVIDRAVTEAIAQPPDAAREYLLRTIQEMMGGGS